MLGLSAMFTADGRYSVTSYGADPSGVADSATAINAASTDAAASGGRVYFPPGTYSIASTVTITADCEAWGATLSYTGAGTAVQVGAGGSGQLMIRKRLILPKVTYANKPVTGWDAGTIGLRMSNINACIIDVAPVDSFETGLIMYGTGAGNVYNIINLVELRNNKINLKLDADATGWTNQNTFIGGRLWHLPAEGSSVAGTRQIQLATTTNAINGNLWLGTSLETANVAQTQLEVLKGLWNRWVGCRWENTGGNGSVTWGAGATDNIITGGPNLNSITVTYTAGNARNQIVDPRYTEEPGGSSSAVRRWENTTSSTAPVVAGYPAGTLAAAYNPDTDYTWALAANTLKGKAGSDANERLRLEWTTGRLYFGPGGAVAAAMYLAGSSATLQINGGHLAAGTDGTVDIGLSASNRFRDLYLTGRTILSSTQVVTGAGTPEGATTAPVGSIYLRTDGGSGTTVYTKESGSGNTGWAPCATTGTRDVQTFTSNGTWTKPSWATANSAVTVICIGGGAGGGSGRRGAAGTVRCGGGGGAGGGVGRARFVAGTVGSTVTVAVGTGGSGGAAVTSDSTDGNGGNTGSSTTFGTFVRGPSSGAGAGGTASAGTGGSAISGNAGTSGNGGAASTTGGAGASGGNAGGCPGGGAGGGVTSGDSASNGGTGGAALAANSVNAAGGVVDSTTPGAGYAQPANSGLSGNGGGGGAASITTAAQAGANGGIYGGGGGGGGASLNGNNSGAGGTGANGICVVITEWA